MPLPAIRTLYIKPGSVCLPGQPARLCTVTASGITITIFDKMRRCGGLGHYTHPFRINGASTPVFAAPTLVTLVNMFKEAGSELHNLDAFIYGGAENKTAPGFEPERAKNNIKVCHELMEKLGIKISGSDTGGNYARKLIFYTASGESITAKINTIRRGDWYPRFSIQAGQNG